MDEPIYNPDDLAFLVSRSLDENLSEIEQARLTDALASLEDLSVEATELRAVDRLVKRWGAARPQLDWDHYLALISAQAADQGKDGAASHKLDVLLASWGATPVEFDEKRFTKAVIARVQPPRAGKVGLRLVIRLGVPLAAAAVLALTVTSHLWLAAPKAASVVIIGVNHASSAGLTDHASRSEAPVAVVSFAREMGAATATSAVPSAMSFGSAGATLLAVVPIQAPPI